MSCHSQIRGLLLLLDDILLPDVEVKIEQKNRNVDFLIQSKCNIFLRKLLIENRENSGWVVLVFGLVMSDIDAKNFVR